MTHIDDDTSFTYCNSRIDWNGGHYISRKDGMRTVGATTADAWLRNRSYFKTKFCEVCLGVYYLKNIK